MVYWYIDRKHNVTHPSEFGADFDELSIVLENLGGLRYHVVHYSLGWKDRVDDGRDTAHEPWPARQRLFGVVLKLFVVGDDTL